MAFIEIDDYVINTDFIAYVHFYTTDYTYKRQCIVVLKDGERIRIDDSDLTAQLRDELQSTGIAVVTAIEQHGDDDDGA